MKAKHKDYDKNHLLPSDESSSSSSSSDDEDGSKKEEAEHLPHPKGTRVKIKAD